MKDNMIYKIPLLPDILTTSELGLSLILLSLYIGTCVHLIHMLVQPHSDLLLRIGH